MPTVGSSRAFFNPYTYILKKSGTTHYLIDSDGAKTSFGTSLGDALQEVYDNTPATCLMKNGSYTADKQVTVDSHVTIDGETFGNVVITFKNALNVPFFKSVDKHDTYFRNLSFDCNGANQGAQAQAMDLSNTLSSSPAASFGLENIRIINAKVQALTLLSNNCNSWIKNVLMLAADPAVTSGIQFSGTLTDCDIYRLISGGSPAHAGYLTGASIRMTDSYFGGTTLAAAGNNCYMQKLYTSTITGTIFDSAGANGVWLYDDGASYCHHVIFQGCHFSNNGSFANNTYNNVKLDGHSHHNSFLGCTFTNTIYVNKAKYNIAEDDANCNYNILGIGGSYSGAATANSRKQGANSIDLTNCNTA